jgi:hypothetical protein
VSFAPISTSALPTPTASIAHYPLGRYASVMTTSSAPPTAFLVAGLLHWPSANNVLTSSTSTIRLA